MIQIKEKNRNKTHLNFEELLETYRDMYNKKATEPGVVLEQVLKDKGNRAWG